MKTRLLLILLLLAPSSVLTAASSASTRVTTLATKVQQLQNTIANQEDGPTQDQKNQLSSLLSELVTARSEVNNSVNLLNQLLSQAGQQNVGGLPSNNLGSVGAPTITDGISDSDKAKIAQVAASGDMAALAALAKSNGFAIEEVTQLAVKANPNAAATIAATIAKSVPDSATKIATAASVASQAAFEANKTDPYQVSLIAAAVAKVVPGSETQVASAVAKVVPGQAAIIALAVATNSPGKAGDIAAAVAKEVPSSAAVIAGAVQSVVPDSSQDIVNKVASATNQDATTLGTVASAISAQVKAETVAWGQGVADAATAVTSNVNSTSTNTSQPNSTTTPQQIDPAVISRSS